MNQMEFTSNSFPIVASVAAMRNKTVAHETVTYVVKVKEDAGHPRLYRFIKSDTTSEDNGDTILVSKNGKRFHRLKPLELMEVVIEEPVEEEPEEEEEPPIDPPPPIEEIKGIDFAKIPDGTYKRDALPGFKNEPGTKSGNSFSADSLNNILLETEQTAHNMELEFSQWTTLVFLRKQADGRALFFSHAKGGQLVKFGVAANANDTSYPFNSDILAQIDLVQLGVWKERLPLTVGCKDFDVFVIYDGKEVWRQKNFEIIEKGSAAFLSYENQNAVSILKPIKMSDSTDANFLAKRVDVEKELGARAGFVTGSIKKKGKEIKLKAGEKHQFAAGVLGYIATGGEASFMGREPGAPGTFGVGTTAPDDGYPDREALKKANPSQMYSWTHDNGQLHQHYVILKNGKTEAWGNGKYNDADVVAEDWYNKMKYPVDALYRFARPGGLQFRTLRVEAKTDGDVVHIDKEAAVESNNAKIWYDNDDLNNHFAAPPRTTFAGLTYVWPKKQFYFGDGLTIFRKENTTHDFTSGTSFVSPDGAYPANVRATFCEGIKFTDGLKVESNAGPDRWGLRWFFINRGGNDLGRPGKGSFGVPSSHIILGKCDNYRLDGVEIVDTFGSAIQAGNNVGGIAKRVKVRSNYDSKWYGSHWAIQTVDGVKNHVYEEFDFAAAYVFGAAESYGGENNIWRNGKFTNGQVASNSSLGMKMFNVDFLFTKHCRPEWLAFKQNIDINRNSGRTGAASDYGLSIWKDLRFKYEGPIDEQGNYFHCIGIQDSVTGVVIDGIDADFGPGSEKANGVSKCTIISSDGRDVVVKNVTGNGNPGNDHPRNSSIRMNHGSIENVKVSSIFLLEGTVTDVEADIVWYGPKVKFAGDKNKIGSKEKWG